MATTPTVIGLVEPIRALRDIIIEHTVHYETGCTISFAVSHQHDLRGLSAPDVNVLVVGISLRHTTFFPPAWLAFWAEVAPNARPLVVTDCDTRRAIASFLRSGARGYFVREHYSKFELFRGISEVAEGRIALSSYAAQLMFGEEPPTPLQAREMQVLQALPLKKKMWTRKEIAELIRMSPRNLDNYISDIGRKLNVSPDFIVEHSLTHGLISAVDDPRVALTEPPTIDEPSHPTAPAPSS